jgi:hypothetical protein
MGAPTHLVEVPLPTAAGEVGRLGLREPVPWQRPSGPASSRAAIAAAHVVAQPFVSSASDGPTLDWEATLAARHRLWSWGLGVAEAMDTAQRGGALTVSLALELVRRSAREAAAVGGRIVAGVATDALPPTGEVTLDDLARTYAEQLHAVVDSGAEPVLMASRQLCAVARHADDYLDVYDRVLSESGAPVLLHWLGEAFDPALAGYWGSGDPWAAAETVMELVQRHPGRIEGLKLSVLDGDLEVALRRRLPEGVRLYTGDDWHYPDLIRGDADGHSHALLGVFDAVAPAAATALAALDAGDTEQFDAVLGSTLELGRTLFEPPTSSYKTGIVFLAWLNGEQQHFRMLGGMESARSVEHLGRVLSAANDAGLLLDPELAARRWTALMTTAGLA